MRRGFFEPRSSLDLTGDAERLFFCTEGHIGTQAGAIEGTFEFRPRSRAIDQKLTIFARFGDPDKSPW